MFSNFKKKEYKLEGLVQWVANAGFQAVGRYLDFLFLQLQYPMMVSVARNEGTLLGGRQYTERKFGRKKPLDVDTR